MKDQDRDDLKAKFQDVFYRHKLDQYLEPEIYTNFSSDIFSFFLDNMLKNISKSEFDSICDEAKEITGNNRMKQYGHPKHNFSNIATFWVAFLKNKIGSEISKLEKSGGEEWKLKLTSSDVAMMMILFKVAREQAGHNRDNIVDMAGYARNIAQIEGEE